jgi:hypothetical protein
VDAADVGVDLQRALGVLGLRRDGGAQQLAAAGHQVGAGAGQPLDDHVDAAVRYLGHLADRDDRADRLEVARLRLIVLDGLQRQEQETVAGERAVDRFNRHRAGDRERLEGQREDDGFAESERRQLAGVRACGLGRHSERIV